MKTKYQELRAKMQEMEYPVSVQETAIGTIKVAKDKQATAREVEALLERKLTPREMVKALQPIIAK